ncbi:STAS domain-containing protein [Azomonas macrocytogenes]|uniref:Anti-anti-sigma factor n=1 Tax=Azomonas macrocytogenes TaxID=69962 RepID=A0A839SWS5_AZOMA|nr:STAS domain-containing protein [Azomonas macrocytogenes]MBB3101837.1 anti-anti-sigma factor [Azomonas macrocytogenes]
MTIVSHPSADGDELIIAIPGRFDFNKHQDFRDCYRCAGIHPKRYVIDFANTTYLDSSALGMLLLLRDFAGGDEADIRLINCGSTVREILSIASFEQLFEIA